MGARLCRVGARAMLLASLLASLLVSLLVSLSMALMVSLLMALLASASLNAQPARFLPTDDATIVESLPPSTRLLRRLRFEGGLQSGDLPAALRNSRRLIELYRAEGDPRFLGYAQAALSPWWTGDEPAVVLLRATIRQARHDFAGALTDLRALSRRTPADPQTWLTLASVEQLTGDYPRALAACEQVQRLGPALLGAACSADVRSLTGDRQAFANLLARYRDTPIAEPASRAWLATVLAEMAWREGHRAQADKLFAEALRDAPSLYLRAAYADFLLERREPARAIAVVRWPGDSLAQWPDGLLLRHLIASQALGHDADAAAASAELQRRFAAAALRGDAQHDREQAIFARASGGDPAHVLALAQRNWARQKEPADALILAQAAREAGAADVLDGLRRHVRETGFSDRRLEQVLDVARGAAR